MTIRIEVEDEICLRVPTKESSKDWHWKGRANALRRTVNAKKPRTKMHFPFKRSDKTNVGPDIRPFGWLAFYVATNSTVVYEMDMIARSDGYRNRLELDLKSSRATSGVNHALLWRCGPQRLSCDLSNPLGWNSPHAWTFNIHSQTMELFLLRDHMFLLIDLIDDFTSGPRVEYMTFMPFFYKIGLVFADFKLYLNANDSNIIDNPCDLEDNAFLILGFKSLLGSVDIPIQTYAPSQNSVLFTGKGHDAAMEFVTPLWNTFHSFTTETPVFTLKELSLNGSYNYCAAVSPQLTDSLVLDIVGGSPRVFLHGFLIRYFMNVKENYFGENMHFKTLEEYQDIVVGDAGEAKFNQAPPKKENDMDVVLSVRADRSCVLMPSNIYSRKNNVRFDILLVEGDMRFSNYYMDLSVKSSPVEISLESIAAEDAGTSDAISNCQLFIDGIDVYGHRLFGAPPAEPTYICNWDIEVGKIVGECTSSFLQSLVFSIKSFGFTLDDEENALPVANPTVVNDITFLRARVEFVQLWLLTEETGLLLDTEQIEVSFNDLAGSKFSKQVYASIPGIILAAVNRKSAARQHESPSRLPLTLACFQTSVDVHTMDRKVDFIKHRARQQHHVRYHDRRTHRADQFLHHVSNETGSMKQADWADRPPAMPAPSMPGLEARKHSHGRPRKTWLQSKDTLHSSSSLRLHRAELLKGLERQPSSTRHPEFSKPTQPDPNKVSRSVSHFSQADVSLKKTCLTTSSAWLPPHFSMQGVQPDITQVPHVSKSQLKFFSDSRNETSEVYSRASLGGLTHAHMGVVCTLKTGLKGFCSSDIFDAISVLLHDLKPKHPVDQLDFLQLAALSEGMKDSNKKAKEVVDIALRVPFIHIRLINTTVNSQNEQQKDHYDATVARLHFVARMQAITGPGNTPDPGPVVLARASEIAFVVSENSTDGQVGRTSTRGSLSDLNFWLSSQQTTRTKLQIRAIELTTFSTRVEYLATLIQRTEAMVAKIVDNFTDTDDLDSIQHLIYHLSAIENRVTDPIFITRPSYILRSAGQHLRLNDTWKIVSRIRHVYQSLPRSKQKHAIQQCLNHDFEVPQDAKDHVLSSFEHLKNWDHDGVDSSQIISLIFGRSKVSNPDPRKSGTLEASVSIGNTSVVINPGPHQSALLIGELDAGVSASTIRSHNYHDSKDSAIMVPTIVVQSYVSQIGLHLDWEIVELIGDTLEQFQNVGYPTDRRKSTRIVEVPEEPQAMDLSVVFGTDNASITLDSINLRLRLASEDLRCSVTHTNLHSSQNSSVIVASSAATAKLKDRSKTILGWKLYMLSIYASQITGPNKESESNDSRLAARCSKLRFDLKEDVLGILNLSHQVIKDEVSFVRSLMTKFEGLARSEQPPKHQDVSRFGKLRVAMFLDDYKLRLALLPSFKYTIAGEVARTSVVPLKDGLVAIDFDLKHHGHSFKSDGISTNEPTPALQIPPITGRVTMQFDETLAAIDVHTTIEQIDFHAAAVRAFIDALNRSDLARILVDSKASARRAQSELDALFSDELPVASSPAQKQDSIATKFACHLTLGGMNIHASAPSIKDKDYHSELDFLLGFTTLSVHNFNKDENVVHEVPQIELNIFEVALGVRRRSWNEDTNYGKIGLSVRLRGVTEVDEKGQKGQVYRASSDGLSVDLYPETASLVVDMVAFFQERLKSFTLNEEARNFAPLRRLTIVAFDERPPVFTLKESVDDDDDSSDLFDSIYSLELNSIQVRWILYDQRMASPSRELEDLIFSIRKVDLKTKREGSARLAIIDLQLQMVPKSLDPLERSANSALLPEVVFNAAHLSTKKDRRFAFQVAGKALDLQLAPDFIVPAAALQKSLGVASTEVRDANKYWASQPSSTPKENSSLLGNKRLASLLVFADFAGAVVNVKPRKVELRSSVFGILKGEQRSRAGRYGQAVHTETARDATLRAPGVALKVEYRDNGTDDPTLGAELKVAASSNVLYPSVVPLILEISSSVREMIGDSEQAAQDTNGAVPAPRYISEETLNSGDPIAILGRCKLNAALWIQRQEFSLSCQPIARVAATASFDSILVTINTVQAQDHERFFALMTTFNNLHASVQHVYSRESTASFEVESIVISVMNSKHISKKPGISAIMNVSPMQMDLNAKQLQDFLLFREIWYPSEMRQASAPVAPAAPAPTTTDAHVQRYQQVASGAFPWNAVVSVQELQIQLDLGQGLGKSVFKITKLWASSKKSSDLEQNLCVGFERVGVDCTGRLSGFVEFQDFHLRTAIRWPHDAANTKRAPLVQGSVGFAHLRVKGSFDYQMFVVADISSFAFLMYNVQEADFSQDRLVGLLDGDKVQVFCTSSSAGQGLALYQAFERLVQEKKEAFESSLREVDRHLRRRSIFPSANFTSPDKEIAEEAEEESPKTPYSLHTDVVVTLREINIGAFPTTFFDTQIFKAEATDAQARFAVAIRNKETQCSLGMTLGQLRVALATVNRANTQALGEISINDIIQRATTAKGGTVMRVPKLLMSMQTFQTFESNLIRYIFKSLFEGKVDVGWNYSRISFIRGMWSAHTKALAQRLGKPLPQSAVKITAAPSADGSDQRQDKITAVVEMPQSRYDYVALEPPIIDTPQLRDLGEATPSLEWAGLHRDRLPNVTHQIIIVTLLEIAREVEDAYTKILGSV